MATDSDIIRNTNVVRLAVSEVLNNRQLAWELSQAKKVCQLEGEEIVWGVEESEFEKKRVEALRDELHRRLARVQQCKEYQKEISDAQEEADFLLEHCRLQESPACIWVHEFKSVDSDEADDKGAGVEFRVLRALGRGGSGVVVEVEPVDEKLKEKVGTLAMKILRKKISHNSFDIKDAMQEFKSAFESDRNALMNIALEGEDMAAVTERTGVTGAHYVGRVIGLHDAIANSDGGVTLVFGRVTFSPIIASDLFEVFPSGGVGNGLSMELRVYIAQSLLRTVAHIHTAGIVHNDIRLENAGFTADGLVVLFDCADFHRPGGPRKWSSPTNTSPESAELRFRGMSCTGSFREDAWGLGFMLYMIFTEGIAAFNDTYPEFLFDVASFRGVQAEWLMRSVESPSFQLRRYGVPDVWIRAISLLLERNGQHRPTVMQVLAAFPGLRGGPLEAVNKQ